MCHQFVVLLAFFLKITILISVRKLNKGSEPKNLDCSIYFALCKIWRFRWSRQQNKLLRAKFREEKRADNDVTMKASQKGQENT